MVVTQTKVTLKELNLASNKLILTVIDSESTPSETRIEIEISGRKAEWRLGHHLCFYLIL